MNDLQLLMLLAMMRKVTKGGNVDDAIDDAENVILAVVARHTKHNMRHGANGGNPDDNCFYCKGLAQAREAKPRIVPS